MLSRHSYLVGEHLSPKAGETNTGPAGQDSLWLLLEFYNQLHGKQIFFKTEKGKVRKGHSPQPASMYFKGFLDGFLLTSLWLLPGLDLNSHCDPVHTDLGPKAVEFLEANSE